MTNTFYLEKQAFVKEIEKIIVFSYKNLSCLSALNRLLPNGNKKSTCLNKHQAKIYMFV